MPTYNLINPSDPYTFEAPNIEVAAAVAVLLSTAYGAELVSDCVYEMTPVLFGWDDWLTEHGIDDNFVSSHAREIASAFESLTMPGDRTSMNDIIRRASELAAKFRKRIESDESA